VLAGVSLLLVASVFQQFRQVGPKGAFLDSLALVPQWKFFGQDVVGGDPAWADDWHVLARVAPIGGVAAPGPWQQVLAPSVRQWWHFIWNPHDRSNALLLAYAEELGREDADISREPTGLAYLALLRACFKAVLPTDDQAVQFALVATRGRHNRTVALHYLSHWHVR
jgi:hypothetical protein